MEFFNRFETIYLWLDSDEVGLRSAEKFAEVLGVNRTIIIDLQNNQMLENDFGDDENKKE